MPGAGGWASEIKVGVSAGDYEGEGGFVGIARCGGRRLAFVEQDCVDVAFEMVDGDEGQGGGKGQGFGVGDADEERAGESGAGGDGDGIQIGEGHTGLGERCAHHGNDGAEMFAAGQLGDDAAIARMGGDLGGYNGAEGMAAAFDNGGGGLVAGGFDGKDEATAHLISLPACAWVGLARSAPGARQWEWRCC